MHAQGVRNVAVMDTCQMLGDLAAAAPPAAAKQTAGRWLVTDVLAVGSSWLRLEM